MIVRDATLADFRAVAESMREADRREVFAARWSDDVEDLVADFHAVRHMFLAVKTLCGKGGAWDPVAIVGAVRRGPGVASVIMIATDRFPEIALPATRWVRKVGLPVHVDPWCHRAQCEAWIGNHASRAWLEALGFEQEGVLQAFGKNREDYLQYARIRSPSVSVGAPPDLAPARSGGALP